MGRVVELGLPPVISKLTEARFQVVVEAEFLVTSRTSLELPALLTFTVKLPASTSCSRPR